MSAVANLNLSSTVSPRVGLTYGMIRVIGRLIITKMNMTNDTMIVTTMVITKVDGPCEARDNNPFIVRT